MNINEAHFHPLLHHPVQGYGSKNAQQEAITVSSNKILTIIVVLITACFHGAASTSMLYLVPDQALEYHRI